MLCLQEVAAGFDDLPGSDGSDQFTEFSRRLPDFHAIEGVATDWAAKGGRARRRFGNMILSRLPVAPVLRHLLPWPADPTVPSMQRCMIEASVHSAFGPVRVMTTHLEYYSALRRRAQIERLRQLNAEACDQSRRVRAHEPTLGVLDKQQSPGPAKTYDFAFVTEDLAARVRCLEIDSSSDASDHQPLVIELR